MHVISSSPTHFTPLQSQWIPYSDRYVQVGSFKDGKGAISVKQVDQDFHSQSIRTVEHSSGFRCAAFGVSPTSLRRLVTGQFDGKVNLWDLQHTDSPTWTGTHNSLVNSVDTPPSPSRPEFLSSSRDGTINVWDTRTKDIPAIRIQSNSDQDDPWVAKFDPNNSETIFGGYKSGNLCAFDLRNTSMFFKHQLTEGICNLDINTSPSGEGNNLIVAMPKGKFALLPLQELGKLSLPLIATLTYKSLSFSGATIWNARYKNNSNYFMTTTNDGYLSLHKQTTNSKENWYSTQVQEVSQLRTTDCGIISFQWIEDKEGLFLYSSLDNTTSLGFTSFTSDL